MPAFLSRGFSSTPVWRQRCKVKITEGSCQHNKKRLPTPAPCCAAVQLHHPQGAEQCTGWAGLLSQQRGKPQAPRSWHKKRWLLLFWEEQLVLAQDAVHQQDSGSPQAASAELLGALHRAGRDLWAAFWSKSTQTRKLCSLFQTKYGKLIACYKRDLLQIKQKQD